jgi:ribonuclease BN (tRNA processing enzyme)
MQQIPCNSSLSLRNDGALEVVFIGTGTAFGRRLFQTNFLLIKGDTHVLVDFGMTGPRALLEVAGVEPIQIENVLPTHSHADHIGGLEYLTLINRYMGLPSGRKKLKLIVHEEYRDVLWQMSLRGGLEFNEIDEDGMPLGFDDLYDVHSPILVSEGPRRILQTTIGGIKIELFHTNHIPGEAASSRDAFITYGLFVDDRIFISGDTKFDKDLIEQYAGRSEVMFHDATFMPNPVHASIGELRTLSPEIRKKMYLMHYPDTFADVPADDFAGYAVQGMRYIFP